MVIYKLSLTLIIKQLKHGSIYSGNGWGNVCFFCACVCVCDLTEWEQLLECGHGDFFPSLSVHLTALHCTKGGAILPVPFKILQPKLDLISSSAVPSLTSPSPNTLYFYPHFLVSFLHHPACLCLRTWAPKSVIIPQTVDTDLQLDIDWLFTRTWFLSTKWLLVSTSA